MQPFLNYDCLVLLLDYLDDNEYIIMCDILSLPYKRPHLSAKCIMQNLNNKKVYDTYSKNVLVCFENKLLLLYFFDSLPNTISDGLFEQLYLFFTQVTNKRNEKLFKDLFVSGVQGHMLFKKMLFKKILFKNTSNYCIRKYLLRSVMCIDNMISFIKNKKYVIDLNLLEFLLNEYKIKNKKIVKEDMFEYNKLYYELSCIKNLSTNIIYNHSDILKLEFVFVNNLFSDIDLNYLIDHMDIDKYIYNENFWRSQILSVDIMIKIFNKFNSKDSIKNLRLYAEKYQVYYDLCRKKLDLL